MQQQQETETKEKVVDPIKDERIRILTQVLENKDKMTAAYKQRVTHTGSLVSASMVYAYDRAFKDILKLIAKGANNEKNA